MVGARAEGWVRVFAMSTGCTETLTRSCFRQSSKGVPTACRHGRKSSRPVRSGCWSPTSNRCGRRPNRSHLTPIESLVHMERRNARPATPPCRARFRPAARAARSAPRGRLTASAAPQFHARYAAFGGFAGWAIGGGVTPAFDPWLCANTQVNSAPSRKIWVE